MQPEISGARTDHVAFSGPDHLKRSDAPCATTTCARLQARSPSTMSAFATPAKFRVNALAQGYDSTPRRSNSGLLRTTAPGTPQRMNPNATAQLPPSIESLGPVTISRLQGLYSDFTQKKHTNLASYNANVEWWRKALETHVSSGSASGSTEALASTSATSGSRFVLQANRQLIDAMRVEGVG